MMISPDYVSGERKAKTAVCPPLSPLKEGTKKKKHNGQNTKTPTTPVTLKHKHKLVSGNGTTRWSGPMSLKSGSYYVTIRVIQQLPIFCPFRIAQPLLACSRGSFRGPFFFSFCLFGDSIRGGEIKKFLGWRFERCRDCGGCLGPGDYQILVVLRTPCLGRDRRYGHGING